MKNKHTTWAPVLPTRPAQAPPQHLRAELLRAHSPVVSLCGWTQLFWSSLPTTFRSPFWPSVLSVPNMQGDTARAHVYSGSRTCPHRWYFQGCSLLLWLKVGQFSYPRDHSYTSSCPVGTSSLSPLRSCPPVSPSSTFPTVSSLSSHWHLHFSSFCPLKGPHSQSDRQRLSVEWSPWGGRGRALATSVLHSTLFLRGAPGPDLLFGFCFYFGRNVFKRYRGSPQPESPFPLFPSFFSFF